MAVQMKRILTLIAAVFYSSLSFPQTPGPSSSAPPLNLMALAKSLTEWPQLERYRKENASLPAPKAGNPRVVFLGDSITDMWGHGSDTFFPGKPYVNRGISGQVTAQMLVRFRQDVIALKPKVVVILGGTNDIADNPDPSCLGMIEDNLTSMAQLARANGIRVVMASITPVNDYAGINISSDRPTQKILALNAWIKSYTRHEHMIYLDYYSAMLDANHALKKEYSQDGLHPNPAGYAVMAPLAKQAIDQALMH